MHALLALPKCALLEPAPVYSSLFPNINVRRPDLLRAWRCHQSVRVFDASSIPDTDMKILILTPSNITLTYSILASYMFS